MSTMTLIIRNNSYLEWNKWLKLSISGVKIAVWGGKNVNAIKSQRTEGETDLGLRIFFFFSTQRSVLIAQSSTTVMSSSIWDSFHILYILSSSRAQFSILTRVSTFKLNKLLITTKNRCNKDKSGKIQNMNSTFWFISIPLAS